MLILDPNGTAPLPATEKDLVALGRYWRQVEEARREKTREERAARRKQARPRQAEARAQTEDRAGAQAQGGREVA